MGKRFHISIENASVSIGKLAIVTFPNGLSFDFDFQIMQLGVQRGFDVVVIDLAMFEQKVLDSEIERIRGGVAIRFRNRRKIRSSILPDLQIHHWMTEDDLA